MRGLSVPPPPKRVSWLYVRYGAFRVVGKWPRREAAIAAVAPLFGRRYTKRPDPIREAFDAMARATAATFLGVVGSPLAERGGGGSSKDASRCSTAGSLSAKNSPASRGRSE